MEGKAGVGRLGGSACGWASGPQINQEPRLDGVKPGEQWDTAGEGQARGPRSGNPRFADREGDPGQARDPGLWRKGITQGQQGGESPGSRSPAEARDPQWMDPSEEPGPTREEAGSRTRSRHGRRGGGAIPLTAGIGSGTALILCSSSWARSSVSSAPAAGRAALMGLGCSGGRRVPGGPLGQAGSEWARPGVGTGPEPDLAAGGGREAA
ncbi:collagen alpha-6(VI) chain-like [Delphinus delphis]|uniref:collagen alpha-6(VI) chain-like n=1 Tax=Delphinus delphis TaxID=9728 RepID=UPI0037530862